MRTNLCRFILACTLAFSPGILTAQVSAENQKIDELVRSYVNLDQFSGSVLVAEKGKVLYSKSYGLANKEWSIANTADTRFRIASVTKQFTAMLIMQLFEEGKIELNGHISDYLPYYRKDIGTKVTIHQLLSHTSGLGDFGARDDFWEISKTDYSHKDFIEKYCNADLETEPGTRYRYSNSGYFILGAIIEALSGKTYAQVLKEKILDVIGMNNSGMEMRKEVLQKQASGYDVKYGKSTHPDYINLYGVIYSAGGMYSTVGDLLKWDRALYTEKLLSKKNMDLMFKPNMEKYAYGNVVNLVKIPELKFTSLFSFHTGAINGFRSIILRESYKQQVVIVLGNTALGNVQADLNPLANNIYSLINGLKYEKPKKGIVEEVGKKILQGSVADGIAFYRKEKQQKGGLYDFVSAEGELNSLGYYLSGMDRGADALAIFKLNVEEFPLSWNTFDSYAEALEGAGEKEKAITNYKRSVELNPDNAHAKEQLKFLMKNVE